MRLISSFLILFVDVWNVLGIVLCRVEGEFGSAERGDGDGAACGPRRHGQRERAMRLALLWYHVDCEIA